MPKKDLRYYLNTINLKVQAAAYHLLDKWGFLEHMKKTNEAYFSELYESNYNKSELSINPLFSTEYITYRYFPTAQHYARHLLFDTPDGTIVTASGAWQEGVALCRSDLKPHYNPLIPAHLALVCYNDFLINKDEKALQMFWTQVNHLEKLGVNREGQFLFYYDEGTWYAGITQALIGSTFIRAYVLTHDEKWKKLAYQTILSFFEPIENGGVFKKTPEGFEWIEEYPLSKKHSFVLNGFIFNLTSLYEYLILCEKDALFSNHLIQLTETLFKTFHHFKRKKYFKYSRFNWVFQNIEYQGMMVCQFRHLYELSLFEPFKTIADMLDKDVDWAAFFRFYDMPPPQYFIEK